MTNVIMMGPSQNFLNPVRLKRLATSGSTKFIPKITNFSICFLQFKNISSGQVKRYPGQRQAGPLFTMGQFYAGARSGQDPSLKCNEWTIIFNIKTHDGVLIFVLFFGSCMLYHETLSFGGLLLYSPSNLG